jgi:hypothetical protein
MAVCWKCAGHCVGLSLRKSTQDARTPRCRFCRQDTCLDPKDGELRAGTSPCPVMATRLIVPEEQLRAAGWSGELP